MPPKRELAEGERGDPSQPRRRGLLVGERMRRNPLTISPKATLAEAKALMDQHRIRHLPVVEGEALVGIITARDISQASFPGPPREPSPETEAILRLIKVGEVMTWNVITTTPEATIGEAAGLLVAHKIGGLPVLEDDRLVGILTDRDIRSAASAASLEQITVGDAMTRNVITVAPETPVQEAAKLIVAHRIGGLPVLKGGELVGIITETDLLKAFVELVEQATLERIAPDYQHRTLTVIER